MKANSGEKGNNTNSQHPVQSQTQRKLAIWQIKRRHLIYVSYRVSELSSVVHFRAQVISL